MDANSLHQNQTRITDDEISELRKAAEQAEFHAFSVRQVSAQRARLFAGVGIPAQRAADREAR